MFISIWPAI